MPSTLLKLVLTGRKKLHQSKNNGQRTRAWTYMIAAGRQNQLTQTPWQLDRFMRTEYPRFMRRFVRNRRFLYEAEDR